jgi:quercetin dioxygenase-like cupin family protein
VKKGRFLRSKSINQTNERKNIMKRKSIAAILAGGLALVTALLVVPTRATPQAGVSSVIIAQGVLDEVDILAKTDVDPGPATDFWKAMISTKGLSRLYVVQNTVPPGGSFGWHSHPGPTLVTVVSGTATEYHGDDPACTPIVHPTGSTYVDAGESSGHLVRNDGNVNLVVVSVRIFPEGATPRIDLPNPGYCPDIN